MQNMNLVYMQIHAHMQPWSKCPQKNKATCQRRGPKEIHAGVKWGVSLQQHQWQQRQQQQGDSHNEWFCNVCFSQMYAVHRTSLSFRPGWWQEGLECRIRGNGNGEVNCSIQSWGGKLTKGRLRWTHLNQHQGLFLTVLPKQIWSVLQVDINGHVYINTAHFYSLRKENKSPRKSTLEMHKFKGKL